MVETTGYMKRQQNKKIPKQKKSHIAVGLFIYKNFYCLINFILEFPKSDFTFIK